MPYRYPSGKRTSTMISPRRGLTTGNGLGDYGNRQTGLRRHEFLSQLEGTSILSGEYVEVPLLRFARSFSGVADTPPTPTASNNYQSARVMNGSKIVDYNAKLNITSREDNSQTNGSKTFYFNIYQIVTSFFDAHTWNSFAPTLCPIDFDTGATDEGEVDFKGAAITLTTNGQKNSKFSQHYMKLISRVEVPQGQSVTFNINRVPPKCRRSNTGMFWGLLIHNESTLNRSQNFEGNVWLEQSFNEIPTNERLPWLY